MRSKFDAQLKELGEKLTLMGAMCEEAIANSAKALLSGDSELAKKLAPLDLEIDRYERDIEALCLRLLLQQVEIAADGSQRRAQIVGNAGDFRIQKRYADAWQKGDAWILQIFLRIS